MILLLLLFWIGAMRVQTRGMDKKWSTHIHTHAHTHTRYDIHMITHSHTSDPNTPTHIHAHTMTYTRDPNIHRWEIDDILHPFTIPHITGRPTIEGQNS